MSMSATAMDKKMAHKRQGFDTKLKWAHFEEAVVSD